jgi:hypothetical protein
MGILLSLLIMIVEKASVDHAHYTLMEKLMDLTVE